jgi:hypothetical protein
MRLCIVVDVFTEVSMLMFESNVKHFCQISSGHSQLDGLCRYNRYVVFLGTNATYLLQPVYNLITNNI